MAYDKLQEELREWIDTNVLAEAIVTTLEEVASPEEMTFENAKKVWLDFLEAELSDALNRSVRSI